jgi:hypothetical protein
LINQAYCGNISNNDTNVNQGPYYKRDPFGSCDSSNQQDFWLNGNMLETFVNSSRLFRINISTPLVEASTNPRIIEMLVNAHNGSWTDDSLWWCLSWHRMWKLNRRQFGGVYPWFLEFWNTVRTKRFNSVVLNGKTFQTTWWQYIPDDPQGTKGYRNAITNSLFLVQSCLVYQDNHSLQKEARAVIESLCTFLETLIQNGLIVDGYNADGTLNQRLFTYTQGVVAFGFWMASRILRKPAYHQLAQTIISNIIQGKTPLTRVMDETIVLSYDPQTTWDNSGVAFNGIFCRYAGYLAPHLDNTNEIQMFLQNTLKSVVKYQRRDDGWYTPFWGTLDDKKWASVASTVAVVDLINSVELVFKST